MFDILIDTPQKRIKKERLATTVNGKTWGTSFYENIFIEPITKACMLAPLPMTPAWSTNASGAFARLRKSDYILTNAYWVEMNHGRVSGDIYLKLVQDNDNPRNELVKTNFNFSENEGAFLSWYAFNTGNADFIQMECGWGDGVNNTISLRFYAGGDVDVAYGEIVEGRYSITGEEPALQDWRNFRQQTDAQTIDVVLIPAFRRRCLLCLTNQGGGFLHVFEQFSANEPDNILTKAEPFWWYVPTGDAKVQCAPLRYKSEGYVTAKRTVFIEPPDPITSGGENDFVGRVFADYPISPPYTQWDVIPRLVEVGNPDLDFVPDGVEKQARIRLDLFGDGFSSPFVYGAELAYPSVVEELPDESESIYPHASRFSLTVPENPNDVMLEVSVFNAENMMNKRIHELTNRAVLLKSNDIEILDGRNLPPDYTWIFDDSEKLSTIKLQIRDRWKSLDNYLLSDSYPLDGLDLSEAISSLVKLCGYTDDDLIVSTTNFALPTSGTNTQGDFAVSGQTGESPAKIIENLHQEFAGNFYYGWKPTANGIKFHFISPEDSPTTPATKVFLTRESAIAEIGGTEENNFWYWQRRVVKDLSYRIVPNEANIIWVTGYDFLAQKPIQARLRDVDSLDVTLEVTDRANNWLGEPVKYAYYSPELTTKEAVIRAARILCKRLFKSRKIYQFSSFPLFRDDNENVPVWTNDLIEIDTIGLVRVLSFNWEVSRDTDAVQMLQRYIANATYVCEFIGEAE